MEDVDLVGLCDADIAKAQATVDANGGGVQVFTELAAMLAEVQPDVLDIVTPPETHHALVKLACEDPSVRTIICQKPLAPTEAESVAIVELVEGYPETLLVVHENFRWQPWYRELRRLLHEEQLIGTCYSVSFRLRPGDGQGRPPSYVSRQPYFQHMPRFLMHETGIHFVDVFRFLLGEIDSVYADLAQLNDSIAGEDSGTVVFGIAAAARQSACISSSAKAILDCNRLVDHDAEDCRLTMGDMLLEGSAGCMRLDGRGRIWVRGRGPTEVEHPYSRSMQGFAGDCVYTCNRHVRDHLLHGAPLANSGREFLRNILIEEAIYASSEQKQQITLPPHTPSSVEAVLAVAADDGVRAELGEGVIWDSRRKRVLWVDILHATIFELDPLSGVVLTHELSQHTQHVTTIVPVAGCSALAIVGTTEGVALVDLDSEEVTQHPSNGSLHGEYVRMNDGKCDPQGRFWVGSVAKTGPGTATTVANGAALYVLDSWAGTPTIVVPDATIANGLEWTPDGRTMYWIDSACLGVDAFAWNAAAATLDGLATQRRRAFATAPESGGCTVDPVTNKLSLAGGFVPDGCALDSQGKLWVALHGLGEVRRYDPRTGEHQGTVTLPHSAGKLVTSCCFGGEALDELYISTAHKYWSAEQRAEMPLGGALLKVSRESLATLGSGIRGLPVGHFRRQGVAQDGPAVKLE